MSEAKVIMADGETPNGIKICLFGHAETGEVIGWVTGAELRIEGRPPRFFLSHDYGVKAMQEECRVMFERQDLDFLKERLDRSMMPTPVMPTPPQRRSM